jgi:hypothetical protein
MNENSTINTQELTDYYQRINEVLPVDKEQTYKGLNESEFMGWQQALSELLYQDSIMLSAAEAQCLKTFLSGALTELELVKKELKVYAQAQWEMCDVNDSTTSKEYDQLKRVLNEKKRVKGMSSKLSSIQKKLKLIASTDNY